MNTSFKNINLKDLLEYLGEDVIKKGTRYSLVKHDSLIVKDSVYYWNSKHESGNAYKLLQSLYGFTDLEARKTIIDFLDAVSSKKFVPMDNKYISKNQNYKKKAKFDDELLLKVKNEKEIFEYLSNKRGIDKTTVQSLVENNLISIDEHKNIIFQVRDKDLNYIGNEYFGTQDNIKFRRNMFAYGFNLTRLTHNLDTIKEIYIFESPIDLISYIEINQQNIFLKYKKNDENVRFLSLSGLKEEILDNYMDNIEKLNVCVDNDQAGEKFYLVLKEKYPRIEIVREKSVLKDWNEDLKKGKGIDIIYGNKRKI